MTFRVSVTLFQTFPDNFAILFCTAAPVKFSWIPRHKCWEQKGEEYRLDGGGGWVWNGGICQLRTRKRRRDITWPTKEEKDAKIRKLEGVVGIVKERKAKIKIKKEENEKVGKKEGEFRLLIL